MPLLPPLPLRQWVFSLPERIRPFLPQTRVWPATCCAYCSAAGDDGSVTFHEATPLTADDVLRLDRKRSLTLPMIRRLSEGSDLGADVLIRESPVAPRSRTAGMRIGSSRKPA